MITVYEEYHDNRVYEQSYDNCDILMHIQRKTVQNFLKCFMSFAKSTNLQWDSDYDAVSQVKVNGEVSFETGETQLGGMSLAINETSCTNLDNGSKGGREEVEMEEVVRREDAGGCEELGNGEGEEVGKGEGEVKGEGEERRNEVPVIDVTTPSQDGSSEHLL